MSNFENTRDLNLDNLERFLKELNDECDDGALWETVTLANLEGWTPEEYEQLNDVIGSLTFAEVADAYEDDEVLAPILCAAFEWLVGPFAVTHPDYDPFWFRKKEGA